MIDEGTDSEININRNMGVRSWLELLQFISVIEHCHVKPALILKRNC